MTTPRDWALLVVLDDPSPDPAKTRHLANTFAQARRMADLGVRVVLCVEPGQRPADAAAWIGDDVQVEALPPGDFAEHLAGAMRRAFDGGASRVVAVHADCPGFRTTHAALAFRALDDHDLVIGPTGTGGLWLLGARDAVPPVLPRMPWSSAECDVATRALASEAGLTVGRLETLGDPDV